MRPNSPETSDQVGAPLEVVQKRFDEHGGTPVCRQERRRVGTAERIFRMVKQGLSEERAVNVNHCCNNVSMKRMCRYEMTHRWSDTAT